MAKEKSYEEQAREMAKSVLEDKLSWSTLGANTAHSTFGDEGKSAYSNFMQGEKVTKAKNDIYNKRKESYKKLGVVGEPSMPTDGDYSAEKMRQINEMKSLISLGDLEAIVNSIGKLDFQIPEKLKVYTYNGLFEKGFNKEKGKFEGEKLTEEEKDAFMAHQLISTAYDKVAAYNTVCMNYLSDINAEGKKLAEKYAPKKD